MNRIKILENRLEILYKIKSNFPKEYLYNNMKKGKTKLGKKSDRVNFLIKKIQSIKKSIEIVGKKPINPIGSCFESSTRYLLDPTLNKDFLKLKNVRLCHGIGVSNMPMQEGIKIAHGWIEFTTLEDNVDIAFDTTWGTYSKASDYRKQLKLKDVIEYTPKKAFKNYKEKGVAPWDKRLKKIINDNKKIL